MSEETNEKLNKIKEVIEAAKVPYEDAEKALKKNNFNVTASIAWLEKNKAKKRTKFGSWVVGLFEYKFIVRNDNKNIVNIPLWVCFIIPIFFWMFSRVGGMSFIVFVLFIIAISTGCEIIVSKEQEEEISIIKKESTFSKDDVTIKEEEYKIVEQEDGTCSIEVE